MHNYSGSITTSVFDDICRKWLTQAEPEGFLQPRVQAGLYSICFREDVHLKASLSPADAYCEISAGDRPNIALGAPPMTLLVTLLNSGDRAHVGWRIDTLGEVEPDPFLAIAFRWAFCRQCSDMGSDHGSGTVDVGICVWPEIVSRPNGGTRGVTKLQDLLARKAITKEEVQALARQQDESKPISFPDTTPHYLAAATWVQPARAPFS